MPRDSDSPQDRHLRLAHIERASLYGVGLRNLLETLVPEVGLEGLFAQLALLPQQIGTILQRHRLVDDVLPGCLQAVGASIEAEDH